MLFNSYEFICFFLPVTVVIFFSLVKLRLIKVAIYWLTISSILFYGYWNPAYVPLLIVSVIGNFCFGKYLSRANPKNLYNKVILWLGIGFNLGMLGYYKYSAFLISSLNQFFNTNWSIPEILLPLGISFYSFTQIAYLVDAYRSDAKDCNYDPLSYILFVVFFPQLIAGPILRHDQLIPELQNRKNYIFDHKNVALGITLFILGLAKKVLIADNIAPWVAHVFGHADSVTFIEAWIGALSYTLQLYFDFSGYSDMAIGLGWIFNFHLPINFNSPYKATSISDFWRRWHITLSHFLRDYLYIPLGGSRKGELRRYTNLIITMLLGGLWHGAGLTYIIWGGLHGLFLAINHRWKKTGFKLPSIVAWTITFNAIMISWIIFRAANLNDAIEILKTMVGIKGISLSSNFPGILPWLSQIVQLSNYQQSLATLLLILLAVLVMPNTQQIMQRFKPTASWATAIGLISAFCLLSLNRVSEFLYFQF